MTQSLHIDTGEIRLAINDDPNRVIVFNPADVLFAERFYRLFGDFQKTLTQYRPRFEALDADQSTDENGMPANLGNRIALVREVCEYIHAEIDKLFGAGTSQKVFDGAMDLNAIKQFFEGVTPFIKQARVEKVTQYTSTATAKRNKRK